MRSLKSVFGVIAALVPIIYCGSLLYYFLDLSGSVEEAKTDGLGPTLLGLTAVGLLFCIPLILKIVRLISGLRPPGSGGGKNPPDDKDEFDADAMLARYLARRSAEDTTRSPASPPCPNTGGPVKRSSFGRKRL